jgi:hypothetical protein
MAEPGRHLETLRAGAPLRVGSTTLLPVERMVLHAERGARGGWLAGSKEPYALVVQDAGGLRALPTGAGAVTLDELRGRLPGLEALLRGP